MSNINLDVSGTKVTLEPITAQTFSLTVPSAVPAVITALATGPQGPGVPFGGTTNQLLEKASNTSFDTRWTSTPTVDALYFDTTAGLEATTTGELVWDADKGTIDIGMLLGVTQKVGEDQYYRVQAAEAIAFGDLVMAVGTIGNSGVIQVAKSRPVYNGMDMDSQRLMGLAASNIASGGRGYVLAFGQLRKLNTLRTGWNQGTILWADPTVPGGLTPTRPAAPAWKTIVALVVTRSAQVGALQVRPTFGSSLGNDELVDLNGIVDGQILRYDSTPGVFRAVTLTASDIGAYPDTNPDGFVDAAGAAAAAPVQSVNGAAGTVVLTTSDVAEGTALYYTDARAAAAAPVQSVNGAQGTVVLTTSNVSEGTALYFTSARASAAAPVQSVNGAQGTVVLTTSNVAEGTALYYTDARASAAAPVQSVNGGTGVVSLDYTDVGAIGTALGVYVYDYGTAIPTSRPSAAAVYWRGTAAPGTAIALSGDLWYDTTGD